MGVIWRLAAGFRGFRSTPAPCRGRNLVLGEGLRNNWAGWVPFGCSTPKACCGVRRASTEGNHLSEVVTQGGVQKLLWQKFLSDPTQWWDNRRSKENSQDPDFVHKTSKALLWLTNGCKPAWVEAYLGIWDAQVDAGMEKPPDSVSCDVEVATCRKLCEDGQVNEAADLLNLLVQRGCHIPNNLFYRVLKKCVGKNLALGKRIHALAVRSGYEGNAFLATHLIAMYASHGRLEEASGIFSSVTKPDAYNWSAIIFAYARQGEPRQAIKLYQEMLQSTVKPSNHIFVAVLNACATAGDLSSGKDVHAHICASVAAPNIFVHNCLLHMYSKCGSLEDARKVFDSLPERDVVTWNAMIAGYAQHGMGHDAISLYHKMQQEGISSPNSITFVSLLQACASLTALPLGKHLHAQIAEQGWQTDVVVGASLVNMYAKCGSVEDARRVFDRLPQKNVVTWNGMIAGYAQQGLCQEAMYLYCSMQQEGITAPDSVTFVCLLQACANVGAAGGLLGKQLHVQIEERRLQNDVAVGASLVNMYSKCRCVENAQKVFDRLPHKNAVTWTAMIAGYAQEGMGQEALNLYSSMQQEGISPPDAVTFVCLLQACASVAALPLGKQLHAQIEERGLQAHVVVGNSLVNMYAKCGSLEDAQQVFESLPERQIVAWGALITGYAHQGDSDIVFDLVNRMKLENIQPDGITFLSVLTVCSHVGLVDKGRKYFEVMRTDYGIAPTVEHYTCMMDLLSRAGHLEEALQMAKTMPFQPNGAVWHTLLGACRKWINVDIGREAFEFAVNLDKKDGAAYVLMSNIYVAAQMWEEAKEMQARRKQFSAWKPPGQSWWTDMGGVVHAFVVGDRRHPESNGIYARLEKLIRKMKKAGYVPDLSLSSWDIPDEEKEAELYGHSEKLAIAYALNKTPQGTTIRIVKNLRVCVDCHTATAYISKLEKRTIICRDASRFHVYKDGKCSCGDYW